MITAIAFYVFAAILLASATMVVSARNPVHAVLFLILAFFNAAALFLIAGAEFLAMTLVIVYVGAVAVLFLFVVMMLDIDRVTLTEGVQRYAPLGIAVGFVLLLELGFVLSGWKFAPDVMTLRLAPMNPAVHNTQQLGQLIYTDYVYLFQVAGLVLFVAMIGAIVLTLRDKSGKPSRHQSIARQIARTPAETLAMVEIVAGAPTQAFLKPLVVETVATHDEHHEDAHHTGHGGH
jgi:NADH-quinone oxidoreductase subunit J